MADETQLADAFIYSTLAADSALNALLAAPPTSLGTRKSIYFDVVPQDVEAGIDPVIIIRHLPWREDDDALGNAGVRWASFIKLQIVANSIAENYEELTGAASRIDELLHLANSSAGKILAIVRKSPYRRAYWDTSFGKNFREVGGIYQVQVSQFA